ncbi:Ig-like domain repeat protein [Dactylosporangium sp. NPDC051541]|uniref:Ig-like domain repeat protein n=1 Tax=Dactylosporangium sp. NPDC051541 TaxID=3363977 RepID=UPI0037BA4E3C
MRRVTVGAALAAVVTVAALTAGVTPALAQIGGVDVIATPNPSVHGENVTVCATVQTPGATGTVTFSGAGLTDTQPLDGSQQACTSSTELTTGTVTAHYNGDSTFDPQDATTTVTVDPATTTTTVTADPDPSSTGQSVQVCATVTTVAPAVGTPTGTVTFSGAGLSDTVSLTSALPPLAQAATKARGATKARTRKARKESLPPPAGATACTTSTALATGTVTAAYNGATGFNGSSGMTPVTVNEPPSTPSNPSPGPAAPSRPLNVAAVAGTSTVTVTWDAPATGDTVTGYTVSAAPGPATCDTTTARTCVLGAVAGTGYTYTVVAHSAAGDSPASDPSDAVTPVAPVVPPTPPSTNLTLTTADGAIATAEQGQRIVFVGTGFAPHSTVTVTIYSAPIELGRVTTDASGAFQTPITLPAQLAAAQHTVVAQGAAPDGSPRAMALAVTVTAAAAATNGATGSLPVTGSPIGLLLLTGLCLALIGVGLLKAGRRVIG